MRSKNQTKIITQQKIQLLVLIHNLRKTAGRTSKPAKMSVREVNSTTQLVCSLVRTQAVTAFGN